MKKIIIDKTNKGQRLDRYLLKLFDQSSRGNVYKMIRKKLFKVNGTRVKEDYFLSDGDELEIYLADDSIEKLMSDNKIPVSDLALDIVYEDQDILIVNKPKGVLTHPDQNHYKNTLAIAVQNYLEDYITDTFKPASVSRLDRNTTGLILFCKNYQSLKKHNRLMRQNKIKKYYETIVEGHIRNSGMITGYLTKDEQTNKVMLYQNKINNDAKKILTKYKLLEYIGDYSLVEIDLVTGRSHQIRVSLSEIKHPIVGDSKYGGKKIEDYNTQILHCYKLVVEGKTFIKHTDQIDDFKKQVGVI